MSPNQFLLTLFALFNSVLGASICLAGFVAMRMKRLPADEFSLDSYFPLRLSGLLLFVAAILFAATVRTTGRPWILAILLVMGGLACFAWFWIDLLYSDGFAKWLLLPYAPFLIGACMGCGGILVVQIGYSIVLRIGSSIKPVHIG